MTESLCSQVTTSACGAAICLVVNTSAHLLVDRQAFMYVASFLISLIVFEYGTSPSFSRMVGSSLGLWATILLSGRQAFRFDISFLIIPQVLDYGTFPPLCRMIGSLCLQVSTSACGAAICLFVNTSASYDCSCWVVSRRLGTVLPL